MRILVLESTSGQREIVDSRLFSEGFAMLRTIVNDLKNSGFEVITTLNKKFEKYESWIDADNIFRHDELDRAIELQPDAALVIAPEGELELIVRRLRREKITVLGPDESAIKKTGDKWETYKILKNKINLPETWEKYPENKDSVIAKPRYGVGSEEVQLTSGEPPDSRGKMMFQERIEGEHASCCLLMNKDGGRVLSVNEQKISTGNNKFEYRGNVIPLQRGGGKKCAEIALRAAKEFDIEGYCGVDLVIGDRPYFMELNPRITTSFVGLSRVIRANLGEILVKTLMENEPIPNVEISGCSVLRIPKTKEKVKINTKNSEELREIPQIASPPPETEGVLEKETPIFLAVGSGKRLNQAENRLEAGIKKAVEILGLDISKISNI